MQIRRFHCESIPPPEGEVALDDGESQHALRVLRLEPGDRLQLMDGRGAIAEAELLPPPPGTSPRKVRVATCRVLECRNVPPPSPRMALFVAPPCGKAFDIVLKAAVELGFAEIHPMLCEYGVSRPDENPDGWHATLLAAMKQSCNPYLPRLASLVTFGEALSTRGASAAVFGASPGAEGRALAAIGGTPSNAVSSGEESRQEIWIGPEGGFSPAEEEALLGSGVCPVTLGSCILRVETAVPALAGYFIGRNSNG